MNEEKILQAIREERAELEKLIRKADKIINFCETMSGEVPSREKKWTYKELEDLGAALVDTLDRRAENYPRERRKIEWQVSGVWQLLDHVQRPEPKPRTRPLPGAELVQEQNNQEPDYLAPGR